MPREVPPLFLALVHFPVYNKERQVVASSLTTINVHDLGRVAATYGVRCCYIVTPLRRHQELANHIIAHWTQGHGAAYNPTRAEALRHVRVVADLAVAEGEIAQQCGMPPRRVATDARRFARGISYRALRQLLWSEEAPFLLLLGTGWGLAEELIARCDYVLMPIYGPTAFNHLPVRVAAGILLDRLLGC
ncbi:MAG: hypothetical protein KatS3mg131_2914 [Candidatus Tectimicrobiota bacterium]|nr:MAG: hypothetical protein KatS3mg131_2914 [Candidatus Tectomicrobia bacterium]